MITILLCNINENLSAQKAVKLNGAIDIGYEYGLLPFVVDAAPPQGNYYSSGNATATLFGIPIKASYYYSGMESINGLNNYFSLQFDAEAYRNQVKEKIQNEKENALNTLNKLDDAEAKLKSQINHLQMMQSGAVSVPSNQIPSVNNLGNLFSIPGLDLGSVIPDNPYTLPSTDSLNLDSLSETNINNELPDQLDSKAVLSERLDQMKKVLALVNKLQNGLNKYKELSADDLYEQYYNSDSLIPRSNAQKLLSKLNQFEIGLCYPRHTNFSINRMPIKGMNVEYDNGRSYLAFTHGRTLNNLFVSGNLIQDNLSTVRNLYNYFDFKNVDAGRRVTQLVYGRGQKEKTHFQLALMHGYGRESYIDSSSTSIEHNLVAEAEGQWDISKCHSLFIAYGRSYIQTANVAYGESSENISNFFDLGERTNALLTSYSYKSKKTGKTELKLSFRYVDPFFKSLGLGFMRSDNMRYELKLKSRLGRKLKLGGFIRHEEDNLLKLYDYKNRLLSFGFTADYKPVKGAHIRADIRPIIQNANSDTLSVSNNNWILNLIGNYFKRVNKESYINITGLYAYYVISNDYAINYYQNASVNAQLDMKNKWTLNLQAAYYNTSDTIVSPASLLVSGGAGVKLKKVSCQGQLKYVFQNDGDSNLGYGFSCRLRISRRVSCELSAEKLVIGDFYNSLLVAGIDDFPYYFNSSLRIQL